MAFVGNKKGPKKSEIAQKLGPDYFGISVTELDDEIRLYRDDEFNGIVDSVFVNKKGHHFIIFNTPDGIQRFYLEENGYHLEGSIDEIRVEDDVMVGKSKER